MEEANLDVRLRLAGRSFSIGAVAVTCLLVSLAPALPTTRIAWRWRHAHDVAAHGSTMKSAIAGAATAGGLGAVALVLAVVGVFGVFSFLVEERRREIGIRLAPGASRRQIFDALLGAARTAIAKGLIAGLGLSIASGLALQRFLFGLSPVDPISYAAVAALLAAAAALATAVPVRRALRIDPAVTLRAESGGPPRRRLTCPASQYGRHSGPR